MPRCRVVDITAVQVAGTARSRVGATAPCRCCRGCWSCGVRWSWRWSWRWGLRRGRTAVLKVGRAGGMLQVRAMHVGFRL